MLKRIAKIVNIVAWAILFLAFVFADVYKLDVRTVEIQIAGLGIFHIFAVILGFIGLASAVVLLIRDQETTVD